MVLEGGTAPLAKAQTVAAMGLGSALARLGRSRLTARITAAAAAFSALLEDAARNSDGGRHRARRGEPQAGDRLTAHAPGSGRHRLDRRPGPELVAAPRGHGGAADGQPRRPEPTSTGSTSRRPSSTGSCSARAPTRPPRSPRRASSRRPTSGSCARTTTRSSRSTSRPSSAAPWAPPGRRPRWSAPSRVRVVDSRVRLDAARRRWSWSPPLAARQRGANAAEVIDRGRPRPRRDALLLRRRDAGVPAPRRPDRLRQRAARLGAPDQADAAHRGRPGGAAGAGPDPRSRAQPPGRAGPRRGPRGWALRRGRPRRRRGRPRSGSPSGWSAIAESLIIQPLGPVVGAHAGPGTVGVGCLPGGAVPARDPHRLTRGRPRSVRARRLASRRFPAHAGRRRRSFSTRLLRPPAAGGGPGPPGAPSACPRCCAARPRPGSRPPSRSAAPAPEDVLDLVEPALVVGAEPADPAGGVREGPAVGGQHQRRLEREQPVERLQELVQRVRACSAGGGRCWC